MSDFPQPYPVQFPGSALARWVLRRLGWQIRFEGLPTRQGILAVYPHTSNWDFLVLVLVKWAIGVRAQFWAKESLFRVPLLGRWLRWLGGVPVDRSAAHGVVAQAVTQFRQAAARDEYFWLALAPEGTRKYLPGWRSGFYRTAVAAGVPLGLVRLDYRAREVSLTDYLRLSGDVEVDFPRIAMIYADVAAYHPELAAPIRLLDSSAARGETIEK